MNTFKNLFFIPLLLLFFACGENQSESSEADENIAVEEVNDTEEAENSNIDLSDVNQLILGTWKNTFFHGDEYIFDDLHIFNQDGSFEYSDGTMGAEGTWKITDGVLIINTTGKDEVWGKIEFKSESEFEVLHNDDTKSVYIK